MNTGNTLLHGNTNVEFMLFEGLNHLFMPSDGDSSIFDPTEHDNPNNVSVDVIKTISKSVSPLVLNAKKKARDRL